MKSKEILIKLANGTATQTELDNFSKWAESLSASDYNDLLLEYESVMLQQKVNLPFNELLLENIHRQIEKEETDEQAKVVVLKRNKKWWMAAAAAIILLGTGSYFIFLNKTQTAIDIAKVLPKDVTAPSTNKAIITLSNGQQVPIDSLASGHLATEGAIQVTKNSNGEIVYSALQQAQGDNTTAYNTLYNPKGSKVQTITLADGSQVWLNAASSLRYPVAFSGKERTVELSGEGYFEVAHNAAMPFKVSVNGKETVEVLGTHFNINAYTDEAISATTLLEGSVKISLPSVGGEGLRLTPGQQAQLNENGKININSSVDIESVMAWKNGEFIFQGENLHSVMRQLERWYNIDVEYKGKIADEEFVGVISRDVNISEILKMLESTGAVKFEIEGRKILVK